MATVRSYPVNAIVALLLALVFQSSALSQDADTDLLAKFQALYSFHGRTDGIGPNGVVLDKAGNLFGTSQPCPQDGQRAFVEGLCYHGNGKTVCTYSHFTGTVDANRRAIKHTFTVNFLE